MSITPSKTKRSFLQNLLDKVSGEAKSSQEQARLEAFLAAFPGEYCGFSSQGVVAYSQGFCDTLGLETIKTIGDIQSVLPPGDAAAL